MHHAKFIFKAPVFKDVKYDLNLTKINVTSLSECLKFETEELNKIIILNADLNLKDLYMNQIGPKKPKFNPPKEEESAYIFGLGQIKQA